MKNILETLVSTIKDDSKEIETSDVKFNHSMSTGGSMTLIKGGLKMDIHYYTNIYLTSMEGVASLDDYDITDYTNVSIGGLPVDNLSAFLGSLRSNGMATVANKIEITQEEMLIAISKEIEKTKVFKLMYGKNAILTSSFTDAELTNYYIHYLIKNYNPELFESYYFTRFKIEEENELKVKVKRIPTIEELTAQIV